MPELNVNALFPTFLFNRDHPDPEPLNAELMSHGELLRAEDPEGRRVSNRGGWQSHDELHLRAEFSPLVGFIEETLTEIKGFLNIEEEVSLRIFACWMNFNHKGDYNSRHVHGNSIFSGVYYVKVPPAAGGIRFFDPNPIRTCFHPPYKTLDPKNCFSHDLDPRPGRVLIFPGYVPHEVAENASGEVRVSMSFNVGLA